MKLTRLSKTACMISLTATLSTIVATSVYKIVRAQSAVETGDLTEAQIQTQADCFDPSAVSDSVQGFVVYPNGSDSFDDFQGINLSSEQTEELDRVWSVFNEIHDRAQESTVRVVDPDAPISFVPRPDIEISDDVEEAIWTREDSLQTNSREEKVVALNSEFGQYGEFGQGPRITYTPEQSAAIRAGIQERDTQIFAMLTPEQQTQFQENMKIKSQIRDVCGIAEYDPDTLIIYSSFEPTTF